MAATTMTVSEARAALSEVVDRVIAGDEVIFTRHGQAVAVLVRPDVLRARRAGPAQAIADDIRRLLSTPAGATQFVTNNRKDFGAAIGEIEIAFADELPPAR